MPDNSEFFSDQISLSLTESEEEALWSNYISSKDPALRLQLIEIYLPFARLLAAKLYSRRQGVDFPFEDYLHSAAEGLIQSIDRFDPNLGSNFKGYAQLRIEGIILNEIPKLSEQHAQIGLLNRLRKQRLISLTETQSDTQVSHSTSLFEEMVELAVGLGIGYMLENSGMYSTKEEVYECDGYQTHALIELGELLQKLVELLPENEKIVIKHHYFLGLRMEEIAQLMQLSKGRVSQLHRQGLKTLKEMGQTLSLNLNL